MNKKCITTSLLLFFALTALSAAPEEGVSAKENADATKKWREPVGAAPRDLGQTGKGTGSAAGKAKGAPKDRKDDNGSSLQIRKDTGKGGIPAQKRESRKPDKKIKEAISAGAGKGKGSDPEADRKKAEKHQQALQLLKQEIEFEAATERRMAIKQLEKLKPEEQKDFYPLLMKFATEDLDPTIRDISVSTLGSMKVKEAKDVFLKALDDTNPDVRRSAVSALSQIEAKDASPRLLERMKSEDFKTNNLFLISIINTLGRFEYPGAASFLVEKSKDSTTNLEVRRASILYLGRSKSVESYDYLAGLAKNEDEDVTARAYAINSLGHLGKTESIPVLKDILEKIRSIKAARERVRFNPLKLQSIAALIRLGDPSVRPELVAAAKDDNPSVRLRAVKQMGEIKMAEEKDLLKYRAEHDTSKTVRKAAKSALDNIDGKSGAGAGTATSASGSGAETEPADAVDKEPN